ncbi:hypothetical protein JXA63_04745 [Candidatus Woesebacteria bacterium]|nr:hypothetical protein [Candidatus Woesebacteria bacterium]
MARERYIARQRRRSPSKGRWIVGGVSALALASATGVYFLTKKDSKSPLIDSILSPTPGIVPATATIVPSTSEPERTVGWDCAKINNPERSGFNPDLPIARNAMRAVEIAGDPTKIENGEVLLRRNDGNTQLFENWRKIDPKYGIYVHNGNEICTRVIKSQSSLLPENPSGFRPTADRQKSNDNSIIGMNLRNQKRA